MKNQILSNISTINDFDPVYNNSDPVDSVLCF